MNQTLFQDLETERLLLRKIVDTDIPMLYKNIYNNFEYYKFYLGVPFSDFESFNQVFKLSEGWHKNSVFYRWGIVLKKSKEVIGIIKIRSIDKGSKTCELEYILSYNHNGQGYMEESLKSVIEFAFDKLKFNKITVEIVTENIKSINVVRGLGMKEESIKYKSYLLNENYYNKKVFTKVNIF